MGRDVEVLVVVVGGWIYSDDIFFAITSSIGISMAGDDAAAAAANAGSLILCLIGVVTVVAAAGRHGGDGEVLVLCWVLVGRRLTT